MIVVVYSKMKFKINLMTQRVLLLEGYIEAVAQINLKMSILAH